MRDPYAKIHGGGMGTPYSSQDIHHAIQQGPITKEFRMNRDQLVQKLNQLRSTEIMSYLQYMQHGYMAVSLLSPGLKSEFQAHAQQELQHADRLANRIQQLGGVPVYNPDEIAAKSAEAGVHTKQGSTLSDMVVADLMLERSQIEAYTALTREIGDQDLVTRHILIGILEETEQHASELADYLKRTADTPQ
jgi:bacterioferritin